MKLFYVLANMLLIGFVTSAQKPFVPHVVFDDNNKVYAVKMTASSFLKFIDSTGRFLVRNITDGKDYFGPGHTVRIVQAGQESKYGTQTEAQALLDYYNQLKLLREQKKVKPAHYSE